MFHKLCIELRRPRGNGQFPFRHFTLMRSLICWRKCDDPFAHVWLTDIRRNTAETCAVQWSREKVPIDVRQKYMYARVSAENGLAVESTKPWSRPTKVIVEVSRLLCRFVCAPKKIIGSCMRISSMTFVTARTTVTLGYTRASLHLAIRHVGVCVCDFYLCSREYYIRNDELSIMYSCTGFCLFIHGRCRTKCWLHAKLPPRFAQFHGRAHFDVCVCEICESGGHFVKCGYDVDDLEMITKSMFNVDRRSMRFLSTMLLLLLTICWWWCCFVQHLQYPLNPRLWPQSFTSGFRSDR